MCKGVPILGDVLGGKPSAPVMTQAAPSEPSRNNAASANAVAELRRRNRSLLSAAGAVGDPSAAITSSGGAIGKAALGV